MKEGGKRRREFSRKEFIEQYVTETKRLGKSVISLVNELVLCEREVNASPFHTASDHFPYFLCLKCV